MIVWVSIDHKVWKVLKSSQMWKKIQCKASVQCRCKYDLPQLNQGLIWRVLIKFDEFNETKHWCISIPNFSQLCGTMVRAVDDNEKDTLSSNHSL